MAFSSGSRKTPRAQFPSKMDTSVGVGTAGVCGCGGHSVLRILPGLGLRQQNSLFTLSKCSISLASQSNSRRGSLRFSHQTLSPGSSWGLYLLGPALPLDFHPGTTRAPWQRYSDSSITGARETPLKTRNLSFHQGKYNSSKECEVTTTSQLGLSVHFCSVQSLGFLNFTSRE